MRMSGGVYISDSVLWLFNLTTVQRTFYTQQTGHYSVGVKRNTGEKRVLSFMDKVFFISEILN